MQPQTYLAKYTEDAELNSSSSSRHSPNVRQISQSSFVENMAGLMYGL